MFTKARLIDISGTVAWAQQPPPLTKLGGRGDFPFSPRFLFGGGGSCTQATIPGPQRKKTLLTMTVCSLYNTCTSTLKINLLRCDHFTVGGLANTRALLVLSSGVSMLSFLGKGLGTSGLFR